jgi:hypothetical protein
MLSGLFGLWKKIEAIFQPWINSWAMFALITLEKYGFAYEHFGGCEQ